jgi:hypothetical protein
MRISAPGSPIQARTEWPRDLGDVGLPVPPDLSRASRAGAVGSAGEAVHHAED